MTDLSLLGLTIPLLIVISGMSGTLGYYLKDIAAAIRELTQALNKAPK